MALFVFVPDTDNLDLPLSGEALSSNVPPVRWFATGATARATPASGAMPITETTIAVIPTARIAFIDALLPMVSAQKREQLLNFAIEDKLTIDPATVHAVVIGPSASGEHRFVVAAIDRSWFAAALAWLQQSGLRPTLAVAETALSQVSAGEWLVQLGEQTSFVLRPDGMAYALDSNMGSADPSAFATPPFALTLALNEAAGSSDSRAAPQRLCVRLPSAFASMVNETNWRSAIGAHISIQFESLRTSPVNDGPHLNASNSLSGVNFLTGPFRPRQTSDAATAVFKPALLMLGALLLLHIGFVALDAWWLARERGLREAQIRTLFQQSFPDATAIVNAPLQMARNLAQLQRERGALGDALIDQLAIASQITAAQTTQIRSIAMTTDGLDITLDGLTPAARDALGSSAREYAGASVAEAGANTVLRLRGGGP